MQPLVNLNEAAELLGITPQELWNKVEAREFPPMNRLKQGWKREVINEWLAKSQPAAQPAEPTPEPITEPPTLEED